MSNPFTTTRSSHSDSCFGITPVSRCSQQKIWGEPDDEDELEVDDDEEEDEFLNDGLDPGFASWDDFNNYMYR